MSIDFSEEFEDRFRRFMAEARRIEDRAIRAMKEFERRESCVVPLYEIRPTKEGYFITVDLPGVEKEEVELTFKGASLVIRAPCRSVTARRTCRGEPQYFVELPLPPGIDERSVAASMKNGLLRIEMKTAKAGYRLEIH